MTALAAFRRLCESLGYSSSGGLVTDVEHENSGVRRQLLQEARRNLHPSACAYFAADRLLAYFIVEDRLDQNARFGLFKRAWNDGRAPLLFCISRAEIHVYSTLALPARGATELDEDSNRLLFQLSATAELLAKLEVLERTQLDSGSAWEGPLRERFQVDNSCNTTLLRNLKFASTLLNNESLLKNESLPTGIVHKLLLRAILILYLEQRGGLSADDFASLLPDRRTFIDCLEGSASALALFDGLARRFNGDLFPVDDDERSEIKDIHIDILRRFLSGKEDLDSGQVWLWTFYDFSIIPISTVSAMYELFLRSLNTKDDGVGQFYTPQILVELVLNEVLPWPVPGGQGLDDLSILDPACGSGIFLVEAFRRVVAHRRARNKDAHLSPTSLITLLRHTIHGMDVDPVALRLAIFSLYICILDHIEPREIRAGLKLPRLTGQGPRGIPNLCTSDAFAESAPFQTTAFDLVVGNPPWERNMLPDTAISFLKNRHLGTAKEIAQAFMWLAVHRAPHGRVALVTSSKWLFNIEGPDAEFRRKYLQSTEVETVINLSAVRRPRGGNELFAKAIGPASVVILKAERSSQPSSRLLYCVPHPHDNVVPTDQFIIEAADVKWLPREEAEGRDDLWKPLMRGGFRDVALLQRLARRPNLADIVKKRGWTHARGFQEGTPEKNRKVTEESAAFEAWLGSQRRIQSDKLEHFAIDTPSATLYQPRGFKRTAVRGIYTKPHVLYVRGKTKGKFGATFVPFDCAFNDTIVGIGGPAQDEDLLKALASYLNSSLVNYILFMSVGEWGVERDRVPKTFVGRLPAWFLSDAKIVEKLARLYDRWVADPDKRTTVEGAIHRAVYQGCSLNDDEIAIVEEAVRAANPSEAETLSPVPSESGRLRAYAVTLVETLNRILVAGRKRVCCTIYDVGDDSPLCIVTLHRNAGARVAPVRTRDSRAYSAVLKHLDRLSLRRMSTNIYVRRYIKLFDGDDLHIVKPNRPECWSLAAALGDADDVMREVIEGVADGAR